MVLDRRVVLAVAALALAVAAVQSVRLWWRSFAVAWRLRRRVARAAAGERRAVELLARRGYRVVGRQVAQESRLVVDGEPVVVALRADLLVTRGGRRYVAEVKTGQSAPSVANPSTRRQLLEYRAAFAVDGVLLVDAETERLHEVEFPSLPSVGSRASAPALAWLLVGGALGALLARLVG